MDNRDWLQISNFAPDGRFVNLFNLRPNSVSGYGSSVDGEIGRFDAQPGIGISEDPNDNNRRIRRMSNYLSLLKMQNENDFESLIQAFDPSVEGVWVPGQNVPLPGVISSGDVFNTPAVWTMYQRFMFMPINQPFITLNRNNQVSTWADPDYPAYQYADANGDGMADSRWFEFTAARDINAGTSDRLRDDVEVLYDRKSYRYFVAARAMDLSALVNVNTATDLLVPPTKDYPLGLTPADVDLRRLLTMQDPASDYTTNGNNLPLSYGQLRRPYRGDDEPAFGPWNPANGNGWVQRNIARNVNDYWAYKQEFDRSIGLHGDLRTLDPDSNAMLIGRYAYDALRRGITLGSSLTTDYRGFDPAYTMPPLQVLSTELVQYERDPRDVSAVPGQITQRQRADQYINVGSLDPTNQGLAWARNLDYKTRASDVTIDYYGSGLYGMEDLSELLTFHGLNDPEVTTRLERVTTGRYESPSVSSGNDILQTRRFGPLMSNRDLSLDRDQHGYTMIDIFRDPSIAPSSADRTLREVNGRVAFNTMAQQALTPRNKITTISGSVPLLGTDLVFDPSVSTALTAQSAAPEFKTVLSNPSLLFGVYSKALAGAIDTPTGPNTNFFTSGSNWESDATNFPNSMVSTLFYGHRGPELALRVAAHTAVNMKDLSDSDTDTTVATLIVNNSEGAALRTALMSNLNPSDATYQLYPGLASGNLFDVGAGVLPSSPLPLKRQVVNVYGFEAMPVITEVSVLYAYTDASVQAGGDEDYDPDSQPLLIPGGGESHPEPIQKISIDGTVGPGNSDYLIEVLAFQLHNPYDQPISLGGRKGFPNDAPLTRQRDANNENIIDTSSNYGFEYYIEYAGRFYKVAKYIEWYPTENHPEGASYRNLDNPANTQAYGTVNNPFTDLAILGEKMVPGTGVTEARHSDFITRNVVLGPRETRVFYVIADKRFDSNGGVTGPDDKWTQNLIAWGDLPFGFSNPAPANDLDMDLLPDGANGDTRGWTGPAEQWVEHQFRVMGSGFGGGGVDPVMMMEFDPRNGELIDESVFADLTVPPTSPLLTDNGRQETNEVRLWKKIVVSGEETTESTVTRITSPTMRNLMENDLLVDRMDLAGTSLTMNFDASNLELT
ncbi:MAG: hypothetical protein JKX70_09240, partial [Phycisphaerales bacterium]|nr:hypothetical protein [Phycisphaerales bacterium]